MDNFAALYYTDNFHLSLQMAGIVASMFGLMNLFARALGGIVSDRCNRRWGLRGRVLLLGSTIGLEGIDDDAVLADAPAAFGHREHDVYGAVREDVEWRELLGGAVCEQTPWGGGGHRRRGRKCGRGAGRLFV